MEFLIRQQEKINIRWCQLYLYNNYTCIIKRIEMINRVIFCITFVLLSIAKMPELVQGGRLKIDCVSTRGFKSHFWHWGARIRGARHRGSKVDKDKPVARR